MPRLPQQLLNSLEGLEGFDVGAFEAAHASDNRITSIRLNPFKPTTLDFELNAPVAWNPQGYYLNQRPSFTLDPLFHAGCYYVQEAGSMFVELALKEHLDLSRPVTVLDLCAAPGGKSTLINSLISAGSVLVANEVVRGRADVLAHNLAKWGTCNTLVTNNDPAKFTALTHVFDALVVDAPCSGSGLFRKQPEAIGEWSEEAVLACALRQKNLLSDTLPALKPGGVLVYSTCSYSTSENEAIVEWLCQEQGMDYLPLPVPGNWGLVDSGRGYRFYPHRTASEGFFCAVLRKQGGTPHTGRTKVRGLPDLKPAEKLLLQTLLDIDQQELFQKNNLYHLVGPGALAFFSAYEKQLYFRKAGTVVGTFKGSDLVPHQELAWSLSLKKELPRIELSLGDALAYLRKQTFPMAQSHKGFSLMTYKNQGLGWAKVLPNRLNNYYPQELRILQ